MHQNSQKGLRRANDSRGRNALREQTISLSPDNINEAKAVVEELKKQNVIRTLQKNPLTDINSIKAIQNSSFFKAEIQRIESGKRETDITLEDIESAFAVINPRDRGKKVTAQQLATKLQFLTSLVPDFDAKVLMNNKAEMGSEELLGLLRQIEPAQEDVASVIFQALDRRGDGHIDLQYVCELMDKFGVETFGEKDFDFLLECMDTDGDGGVGLEDLRQFLGRPSNGGK